MISKAYIQKFDNKLEPENLMVKNVLESRGIECQLFTTKLVLRNQLHITKQTFVVGDNPTMLAIFKRLGIPIINESYPESIKKYLKRPVWESTIRKLLIESHRRELTNVFIKPKSKAKLFTGFVLNSNDDLYKISGISKNTDLYCSSVVEWISEFRVFVTNSKIVGIKNYWGDSSLELNMKVVENAIQDLENSTFRTEGYGIDFGILKNGETALVEWNDGYALGAYGLDKEKYTDLLLARWNEILTTGNL